MSGEKSIATAVTLTAATREQEHTFDNLLQFYHHDATDWFPLDVAQDGQYRFRPAARFWSSEGQHPFLIHVNDALAGFAVVDDEVTDANSDFNMGYLFILRRYRKRGIGRHVAHQLFAQFRGNWEVYQVRENIEATAFWRRVINEFTQGQYTECEQEIDGRLSVLQTFFS